MMRESMSRPSGSVPSGKRGSPPSTQAGGSLAKPRNCSIGECGASNGANTAIRQMAMTMTRPITAPRFSRKDRQNSRRGPGTAWREGLRATSAGMADPRVDDAVEHVDQEIEEDDDTGDQQDAALEGRIVAPADRFDEPVADARPGEDRLGEHGAGHEGGDLEPDRGDDRDKGVAQSMDADDADWRQALGAGGADI